MALDTNFRADGNFLVERVCASCGKKYFVHAMQNAIGDNGLCGSCEEEIWELETMFGKHSGEIANG